MVYKDSAGKEIHEGDSLMDLTPGFVGEISEVFLDEDEGELAVKAKVHEDGRLEILKSERIGRTRDISKESRDRIIEELKNFKLNGDVQQLERPDATY